MSIAKRTLLTGAAPAAALLAAAMPARAQAPGAAGTALLDEIQRRRRLLVGIDLGTPPFGLSDANMQPDGADVAVGKLMAKDLGVEFELVPVTGPSRVPAAQTGKADVVIASFSITPERAKSVAFSIPYGALKLVVFGPKDTAATKVEELAGKRLGVTRGGIQDTDLTALSPRSTTIVRFDDDATVAAALLAGQVDLIATADHIGVQMAKQNPSRNLVTKFVVRTSPYAIGMRRGDADWARWVNTWIMFRKVDGTLGKVYQTWMGSELPELPTF
jgi:polar amino acid transport system substrate-binding protein